MKTTKHACALLIAVTVTVAGFSQTTHGPRASTNAAMKANVSSHAAKHAVTAGSSATTAKVQHIKPAKTHTPSATTTQANSTTTVKTVKKDNYNETAATHANASAMEHSNERSAHFHKGGSEEVVEGTTPGAESQVPKQKAAKKEKAVKPAKEPKEKTEVRTKAKEKTKKHSVTAGSSTTVTAKH